MGDLEVAFRGTIDRIDVTTNGQRAFLYDYKTGGASGYRDLEDDPLMAGRHVQLALYRRAVLASMPELDEEDVDGAFWFVSSRGEFKMLPSEPSEHDIDQRLEDVLTSPRVGSAAESSRRSRGRDVTAGPGSAGTTASIVRMTESVQRGGMPSGSANKARRGMRITARWCPSWRLSRWVTKRDLDDGSGRSASVSDCGPTSTRPSSSRPASAPARPRR